MPTYLTHPEHGTHIAYTQTEIDACKKSGWTVYGDSAPRPKSEEAEEPKRRGRPPKVAVDGADE